MFRLGLIFGETGYMFKCGYWFCFNTRLQTFPQSTQDMSTVFPFSLFRSNIPSNSGCTFRAHNPPQNRRYYELSLLVCRGGTRLLRGGVRSHMQACTSKGTLLCRDQLTLTRDSADHLLPTLGNPDVYTPQLPEAFTISCLGRISGCSCPRRPGLPTVGNDGKGQPRSDLPFSEWTSLPPGEEAYSVT